MKIILKVSITIILFSSLINAQEQKTKRADKKFDDYAFVDAIENYEQLVNEGYSKEDIFKRLGNANYLNAKYGKATEWYGKLLNLEAVEIEGEYMYRYAQCLKSIGKYKEADFWMTKFEKTKINDTRANLFSEKPNYLEEIKLNSGRYDISNLDVNSAVSDFSPAYYKDNLVFSTARDTGITSRNIHQWNKGSFLNLYEASITEDGKVSEPKRFSKKINTKTHEASAVFTKDGNTVYFTRNNSQNGKFERDDEGISRLKIYRAILDEGEWSNIQELPFNSDSYSVAHPALSNDEMTLYFSSDMPGTVGASDIFKVSIKENGSFGVPENLGHEINTESRETFPFVSKDILYFASDGHPGLGGLDVFAVMLNGSMKDVINLGEPINGREDDFSYIVDENGKGYFASNRTEGKGDDDIYSFVENQPLNFSCFSNLEGIVVSLETKEPIGEANVSILDEYDNIVFDLATAKDGGFETELDCKKKNYKIVISKEGYQSASKNLTIELGQTEQLKIQLLQATIEESIKRGSDLISYLELDPILFDLNKAEIRRDAQPILKVAANYLQENSDLKIEIRSHTDTKASDEYNQKLSNQRAKATRDYLVNLGISTARISYEGFGEGNLLNDCKQWKNCSAQENEKNRRSEIIVVD